jgi:hypothetical protein
LSLRTGSALDKRLRLTSKPGGFIAAATVWSLWAVMVAILVGMVAHCGANIPLWDEYHQLPLLIGEPVHLRYLWMPWSEHRVPMTRLILIGLARLTHADFRAPMFASILILAVWSLAMLKVARRTRGYVSITDAFLPMAVLHVGHQYNLLEGWNIQNAAFAALAGTALMVIVVSQRQLPCTKGMIFGLALLLLPMNGAAGAILVPGLALWLAYAGLRSWHAGTPLARRHGAYIIALALAAIGVVLLYFTGLTRSTPPNSSVWLTVRGAVMFLSVAFGPAGAATWPCSGIAVMVLTMLCAALLTSLALRQPQARLGALGIMAFLVGFGLVGLAIGWGRSGLAPYYCLDGRYALLSAPAICAMYLAGNLLEPRSGRWLQWLLFLGMCLAQPANFEHGWTGALAHRRGTHEFARDVQRGVPIQLLIKRYHWLVPSWTGEEQPQFEPLVLDRWRLLRRVGHRVFKDLRELPPYRRIEVSVNPLKIEPVTQANHLGYELGCGSKAIYRLTGLEQVLAIRIRCSTESSKVTGGPVELHVSWKDRTQNEQSELLRIDTASGERVLTSWIDEWIDQFAIESDNKACAIKILKLGVLVPNASQTVQ